MITVVGREKEEARGGGIKGAIKMKNGLIKFFCEQHSFQSSSCSLGIECILTLAVTGHCLMLTAGRQVLRSWLLSTLVKAL